MTLFDHYEVVENLIDQRRWDLAIREIDRLLTEYPEDADLLANRALVLAQLGDSAGAQSHLARALAIDPESPHIHYLRGRVQRNLGELQNAVASFDEAIRLSPEFARPYLEKALVYYCRGAYVNQCQEAGVQPDASDPDFSLLRSPDEELRQALNLVEQAILLDPADGENFRIMATILLEQGNKQGTVEAALKSLEFAPENAAAHEIAGDAYLQLGDYETALGYFTEAKQLDPTNEQARKKVVDAFSHHNWCYRNSMYIVELLLAPVSIVSRLPNIPGGFVMLMIGCGVYGFVSAMLEDDLPIVGWILPVVLWLVIGPLLLGGITLLISWTFSIFSLQFTSATRRWLTVGQVWIANTLIILFVAIAITIVLLFMFGRGHPAWVCGPFIAAAASPAALYLADRLTTERLRKAWLAPPYLALTLVWPVLLIFFRPFSPDFSTYYLICALVWFLGGVVLFYDEVQGLAQSADAHKSSKVD